MQAAVGQAPARQAAIFAGLSSSVEATTINKVCASGLKSVALAAQDVQLGLANAVVAGGMENMSRVPLLMPRASGMPAFGEIKVKDAVVSDGLWDPYNDIHMGKLNKSFLPSTTTEQLAKQRFGRHEIVH